MATPDIPAWRLGLVHGDLVRGDKGSTKGKGDPPDMVDMVTKEVRNEDYIERKKQF